MAKIGVRVKIDVTKIEKARLYKGQKGTYLDATCFIDIDDEDRYGNHGFIAQDVTKEEREAGTHGPIVGNVKVFYRDGLDAPQQVAPQQVVTGNSAPAGSGMDDFSDDTPFAVLHSIYGG